MIELNFKVVCRLSPIEEEEDGSKKKIKLNQELEEKITRNFSFTEEITPRITQDMTKLQIQQEIDRSYNEMIQQLLNFIETHAQQSEQNNRPNISNDWLVTQYRSLIKQIFYLSNNIGIDRAMEIYQQIMDRMRILEIPFVDGELSEESLEMMNQQVLKKRRYRLQYLERKNINEKLRKMAENKNLNLKEISRRLKAYGRKNNHANVGYVFDEQKQIRKGKTGIINAFKDYWKNIFTARNIGSFNFIKDGEYTQNIDYEKQNFTIDDLTDTIRELKNNKSPGPNGLLNEVFKALNIKELQKLLILYNTIWKLNCMPQPGKRQT